MKNYFELLQIPIQIKIDKFLLDKNFYALIKKYHPDFVYNLSDAEREKSLQISAELNEAKKIFNDEDKTIVYLLQFKNIITPNEKYELPSSFLMEILEINEAIEEAKIRNDAEKINTLKLKLAEQKEQIYEEIKSIVAHYEDRSITKEDLEKLKDYHYKKQYIRRIEEKI